MALEFTNRDVVAIATALLGEPNKKLSSRGNLRFGNHGSMSVDTEKATFFDNEIGEGGGILDLVERTRGLKGRDAISWLREQGVVISDDRPQHNSNGASARMKSPWGELVATFDYVDEAGKLLFQVCRFESDERAKDGKREKTFRQRRPDPEARGGWDWKVQGTRQVPFKLPELIEATASDAMIFVAEGEKAVNALRGIGVPATCNAGGAGKWPDGINEFFRNCDVVILPDNDDPGRKHATLVASKLHGVARTVRTLALPDLGPKEDVVEWIDRGGTAEALYDLVDTRARPYPDRTFISRYGRLPWADLDVPGPEHDYLVTDFLTIGEKSVIGGPSRSGKSFLAIHTALAVCRGTQFFGRPTKRGLVVYQAGEGARGIKKRLRAYRKHFEIPPDENVPFELLQSHVDLWRPDGDTAPLIAEIKQIAALHSVPLRLVVIDTLATATAGADENSGKDMSAVMANISRINDETGAHVMLVHHMNADGKKLRGHTSVYANVDQVILVTRNEETGVRKVVLDKQKDDEDGISFNFELLSVEIGRRDDDRPITSCVVVDVGEREKAIAKRGGFKLRDQEALLFRALLKALAEHGEQAPSVLELPLGTRVVKASFWKAEFEKIAPYETGGTDDTAKKRRADAIRKALERAGASLLKFGVIGRNEPWIWWTGKPVAGFRETFGGSDAASKRSDTEGASADTAGIQSDTEVNLNDMLEF